MLNISYHRVHDKVKLDHYQSFGILAKRKHTSLLIKILVFFTIFLIAAMFLPWTQNIRARGYVTTIRPDQRPQTVQALIGGRIEKWFVREGDIVSRGDTIMQLSEIKEEYLDPQLLQRTDGQIRAKQEASTAYGIKASNLQDQYVALQKTRDVKLEQNTIKISQTMLKIESDSMELMAERVNLDIAKKQLDRMQSLFDDGLKSLTDLEGKKLSFQKSQAKVVALENKIGAHRNELENLVANKDAIQNEYAEKLAKSQSDRMSALSSQYDAEATVNKLQSQYNAYSVRQQNYFITSPIDGYVTQALQSGIGEMIKNGERIVSIMPEEYDLAVEMYVDPVDVPLLERGQKVRVQFDGWPAIVFSGWPNSSFGTFGGVVFAIDNFISDNGKYRVLVAADPEESPWPKEVRVGGGANTITLLKNVKVGYEIWRQLNGFPPDYYKAGEQSKSLKTKAPLKRIK
jgi:multidrug efflux pump subunit AcrA (membrane-fusion protein)